VQGDQLRQDVVLADVGVLRPGRIWNRGADGPRRAGSTAAPADGPGSHPPGRPGPGRCAADSTPGGRCSAGWTRSWSPCPASSVPRYGAGSSPGRPPTGTGCPPRSAPARSAPPSVNQATGRTSTARDVPPPGQVPGGERGGPRRGAYRAPAPAVSGAVRLIGPSLRAGRCTPRCTVRTVQFINDRSCLGNVVHHRGSARARV
jgi:hypothetical protein